MKAQKETVRLGGSLGQWKSFLRGVNNEVRVEERDSVHSSPHGQGYPSRIGLFLGALAESCRLRPSWACQVECSVAVCSLINTKVINYASLLTLDA